MTASILFDAKLYNSQLSEVQGKLEQLNSVQQVISKKDEELEAMRLARKEEAQRLLEYKRGLDLRSVAKKDREARTSYLREVGILLPNEFIAKVREVRVK